MNRQEAVALTRYVKAYCPQQAIDEYTPDAWHDLLGDLDLDTCRQAAGRVARRQPFVAPAEIRAEVRTERASIAWQLSVRTSCSPLAMSPMTRVHICSKSASGSGWLLMAEDIRRYQRWVQPFPRNFRGAGCALGRGGKHDLLSAKRRVLRVGP